MKKIIFVLVMALFSLASHSVGAAELSAVDTDADGLPDDVEVALGTYVDEADTDADGYDDGVEVKNGYNPLKGDKDRNVQRRVEVNLATQSMEYFLNNVKVGVVKVSTGAPKTPTPKGEFAIMRKRPIVNYIHYPNTKWNVEFKKGFYIHGAYWHNNFGIKPVSGGCVNVAYRDMESMYSFLSVGDKVKVYGKAPTSPLTISRN